MYSSIVDSSRSSSGSNGTSSIVKDGEKNNFKKFFRHIQRGEFN